MAKNTNYVPPGVDPATARASFGERLRVRMNQQGWTQSEFGRVAGVARDAISNYVRGMSWPDPGNLKRLAVALGCQPSDLIPAMTQQAAPVAEVEQVGATVIHLRINRRVSLDQGARILAILSEEPEPVEEPTPKKKTRAKKATKRRRSS